MKSKIPVIRARRERGQKGNALIEFALMSTVLMGMTLGVADFGRIFSMGNKAYTAAAAGTSFGALDAAHYSNFQGMQDAAVANLGGTTGGTAVASQTCRCEIGGAAVDCQTEDVCGDNTPKITYITVEVTIPFQGVSMVPMVPGLTQVKGKSTMRVE
jgi:Flp pilus assembly protein TadG